MTNDSPLASWKPIPGWEGFYEASDHGEVRSLDRDVRYSNGTFHVHRGRVLKHKLRKVTGHHDVLLQAKESGRKRNMGVHQAVLWAFTPRPEGDYFPCHRNGDPDDNRLVNLYWGTASQNMNDKKLHGTDHQLNKDRCPRRHLYAGANLIATMSNRNCMGQPGSQRNCRACVRTHKHLDYLRQRGRPLPDFDALSDEKYARIMSGLDDGTRCKRGHLLVGPNLKMMHRSRGDERVCVSCRRAGSRVYEARKRGLPEPDFDVVADERYDELMAGYVAPVIPTQREESPTTVGA